METAVNRLAHRAGIEHAAEVKARLCADLEAMRLAGATHAELWRLVSAWRSTSPGDTNVAEEFRVLP